MPSEENLRKFRKIYKDKFKKEISNEEAVEKVNKLINLFKAVINELDVKDKGYVKTKK